MLSKNSLLRVACSPFLGFIMSVYGAEPIQVDVCDLLATPLRYNGVMVKVTGVIETGGGLWLTAKCQKHVIAKGQVFPDLIAFADPTAPWALHSVDFRWDEADRDRLRSLTFVPLPPGTRPSIHGVVIRMSGTVIGLFETRPPDQMIDKFSQLAGFGDQGVAPAQILIKRTIDIRRID
jgi:hypothetical protein